MSDAISLSHPLNIEGTSLITRHSVRYWTNLQNNDIIFAACRLRSRLNIATFSTIYLENKLSGR